jgi:hypothetical protein
MLLQQFVGIGSSWVKPPGLLYLTFEALVEGDIVRLSIFCAFFSSSSSFFSFLFFFFGSPFLDIYYYY